MQISYFLITLQLKCGCKGTQGKVIQKIFMEISIKLGLKNPKEGG
jgi:hypothetical protein